MNQRNALLAGEVITETGSKGDCISEIISETSPKDDCISEVNFWSLIEQKFVSMIDKEGMRISVASSEGFKD